MFFKAYAPFVKDDVHWSVSLNNYVCSEWNKLDESVAYLESRFSREEESDIVMETNKIIFTKLNISPEEYDRYDDKVDWDGLDEMISYYLCLLQ
jgi:hypothetical protein